MRSKARSSIVVAYAVILLSVSILASDHQERVARSRTSADAVEWLPLVEYETLLLTVTSPDGSVISREFGKGEIPTFRLTNLPPESAVDGSYVYELRVAPRITAAVKKQLRKARDADDERAIARIRRENNLGEAVVQSGGLFVIEGKFVRSDRAEPSNRRPASAHPVTPPASVSVPRDLALARLTQPAAGGFQLVDQVIPDDLIVQSSACVGFDCVNNESFGFDTIRLKEHNLRIKFEDTSTAAGFPPNDWQLTANDSASGGRSMFAINDVSNVRTPFLVLAGAPSNSMVVNSSGRIGLRTSTPTLDVHAVTSNTPAVRLQQDNTGGFTAQTWDIAGNEANFFVRDVTGGSRLPLRIRPGASTSSIDISADGDIGINTTSPNINAKVDINDTTQQKARLVLSGQEFFQPGFTATDGIAFLIGVNRPDNRQLWIADSADLAPSSAKTTLRLYPNVGEIAAIATDGTAKSLTLNGNGGFVGFGVAPAFPIHHASGAHLTTGGVWTNASSREGKRNIHALDERIALRALQELRPVQFEYNAEPGEQYVGFLAEDVPALVANGDRKGLSSMDILAVLTKVIQNQQKVIDELANRVDELEKKK